MKTMKQKTMRIIITDNDHVHNEHAHVVYDDAKQQEVPTKATKSVTYNPRIGGGFWRTCEPHEHGNGGFR